MKISFYKMAATGNDFILVDRRNKEGGELLPEEIKRLCTRRTGIGADGMLFLHHSRQGCDFRMSYFNADGNEVEMCGNGARAMNYLYHQLLGRGEELGEYVFETQNGVYSASVKGKRVRVEMTERERAGALEVGGLMPSCQFSYYIETGVPHCVYEVANLDHVDVLNHGKRVRENGRFSRGANCNFFELKGERIFIRTFERGVEEETLACGTGVVAVALSLYHRGDRRDVYPCQTQGGEIFVEVENLDRDLREGRVFLCGEVEKIYDGEALVRDL